MAESVARGEKKRYNMVKTPYDVRRLAGAAKGNGYGMFFYEGYICPVCKEKFKETDDIVACPQCGAPHHRACWKQEGRCHFEADHGTPRQWKRPEEPAGAPPTPAQGPTPGASGAAPQPGVKYCPSCGQKNVEYAEFCSRCGKPLPSSDWWTESPPPPPVYGPPQTPPGGYPPASNGYGEYAPFHMPAFDPYGGVPQDETIEGESATDLVTFVGPNSAYYLPRFSKMSRTGSRLSWNWPAFLITPYWLLYRKNYLVGCLLLVLSMIQSFISGYIMITFINPALGANGGVPMYGALSALMQSDGMTLYIAILSLLSLINLLVRIFFGLTGNAFYRRCALKRIRTAREKAETDYRSGDQDRVLVQGEYRQELIHAGGVSIVLVSVASGILWFSQILFQALFLYQ